MEHTHTHGHMHPHEHTHVHDHDLADGSAEEEIKIIRLLEYIYTHNISHTEELNTYVDKLKAMGQETAAQKLMEAVKFYQEGNENIHLALHVLPAI